MFKLEKPKAEEIGAKAKEIVKKIGKRNIVIIASVLVVGAAVWLNIALFSGGMKDTGADVGTGGVQGGAPSVDGDDTQAGENTPDDVDSFFASAQVERKRSRDEAIEVLQLVVENPDALEESKNAAMEEISKIAKDIDNESKIESLVVAKGFDKCVAVISDSKCNVIVKTEETLLPNQIAQIFEIVYQQSGILPVDVKIIEKA